MGEFIYGIEALKAYRDNLIGFVIFFRRKSTLGCLRNMVRLRISPKVDICLLLKHDEQDKRKKP